MAKAAGVTFDFLEKELSPEEESNFQPLNVKGRGKSSWFNDLDADLSDGSLLSEDSDSPRVVNGKLIGREATQGVRVGSAGGWTLEVFPGDFVVHRKYGRSRMIMMIRMIRWLLVTQIFLFHLAISLHYVYVRTNRNWKI